MVKAWCINHGPCVCVCSLRTHLPKAYESLFKFQPCFLRVMADVLYPRCLIYRDNNLVCQYSEFVAECGFKQSFHLKKCCLLHFMKSESGLCIWSMWWLIKWIGLMKLVRFYKLYIKLYSRIAWFQQQQERALDNDCANLTNKL